MGILKPAIDLESESWTREELIENYLPLVRYLAHHISMKLPSHVELDDLIHAGVIGLIDAVDKYDRSRGIKFRTYADFRIRGSILDSLRSLDWVPRSVRKQKKIIEQTNSRLEQRFGRQATEEELSHEMGIEIQELHRLQDMLKSVSIGRFLELSNSDSMGSDDSDITMAFIVDDSTDDPYCALQKNELIDLIAASITRLPDKERVVVSMYYFDELTMKEIGSVLGITESRISQLHTKAMHRLRSTLSNSGSRNLAAAV